jgi:hypothetical protein
MSTVKMRLFDNAVEFVQEGLRNAIEADTDQKRLKYAIICLVQAVELAVKAKLATAHPILIYADIDRPLGDKNTPRTVAMTKAIPRLERVFGVKLLHKDAFDEAAKLRNDIIHHEYDFSETAAKLALAKVLGLLIHLFGNLLKEDISALAGHDLWLKALSLEKFLDEVKARADANIVEKHIDKSKLLVCPRCGLKYFNPDGNNTCYTCGHEETVFICIVCKKPNFESLMSLVFDDDGDPMACNSCLEQAGDDYYDDGDFAEIYDDINFR